MTSRLLIAATVAVVAGGATLPLRGAAAVEAGQAGAPPSASPGISPPGANDWSCKPSPPHPEPVVLVHGTFENMTASWNLISPTLKARGYCVFALDYGNNGTQEISASAKQLAAFVDRVLAATGAARVSIVGHSQGGMMPRYYLRFLGGSSRVAQLIGLAPSNHGTTTPLAPFAGANGCPACGEQVAGSPFLQQLNAGHETEPGVAYTVVETRYDEVVTPYTSAFLNGAGVVNVLLQATCPGDPTEHIGIQYDPVAVQWVENAVDSGGTADPSFRPVCA